MTIIKDWANKRFSREKEIEQHTEVLESSESREKNKIDSDFYKNAKAFEKDRLQLEKSSKRTWQIVSGIFVLFSFTLVIAIILLTPLKQTVPYLVRVDNNSGYTDVIKQNMFTSNAAKNDDDVMLQFSLKNYLRFHENYNWATVNSNDQMIKKESSSDVYQAYSDFQTSKNGYMAVLGDNNQIEALDIYFTPLPENTAQNGKTNKVAQLRYTKRILNARGEPDPSFKDTQWLVIVSYNFDKPKDADFNPLGLNIVSFGTPQQLK